MIDEIGIGVNRERYKLELRIKMNKLLNRWQVFGGRGKEV